MIAITHADLFSVVEPVVAAPPGTAVYGPGYVASWSPSELDGSQVGKVVSDGVVQPFKRLGKLLGQGCQWRQRFLKLYIQLLFRLRAAFLEKIPRLGDRYFQSRLLSDMAERSHAVHAVRTLPEQARLAAANCPEFAIIIED